MGDKSKREVGNHPSLFIYSNARGRSPRALFPICAPCTKFHSNFWSLLPIDFFPQLCYTIIVVKGRVALTEYNGAIGSTPYH